MTTATFVGPSTGHREGRGSGRGREQRSALARGEVWRELLAAAAVLALTSAFGASPANAAGKKAVDKKKADESAATGKDAVAANTPPVEAPASDAPPVVPPSAEVPLLPPFEVPPPKPTDIHSSWDDRLVMETWNKQFSLQPIAIVQVLGQLPINPQGDPFYEGTGFSFRRGALGFDSRLLGFARVFFLSNIASGSLALWDYFADLDFFDGAAVFRAGRFRPWLARQRLLAGDRYQMIQLPAAMTDLLDFGDGRDLGVGVFGLLCEKKLEYEAGVWNGDGKYAIDPGNGPLATVSDRARGNFDFEVGLRVVGHPYGYLPAFDESDLAYSETPRLSFGGALFYNKRHDQHLPDPGPYYIDDRVLKAGLEVDYRLKGFSLEAEAFLRKAWGNLHNGIDQQVVPRLNTIVGGWGRSAYVQAGYFIIPHTLEVTARFDYVDVEPLVPGFALHPAQGLNWFLHGYNVMLQIMYRENVGVGFQNDMDLWRSMRPQDRTDNYIGSRPLASVTHDYFVMLQTSL